MSNAVSNGVQVEETHTNVKYSDILSRLTAEAEDLFCAMVEAHLAASPGEREFHSVRTGGGVHLLFQGPFPHEYVDGSALNDLHGYGLLRLARRSKSGPVYEVSSESLAFYRWLQRQRGEVLGAVEAEARRLVDGESFSKGFERAAHHLREAGDLIWSHRTDIQTVSEAGNHLRNAIIDAVEVIVGTNAAAREEPAKRLGGWLSAQPPSVMEEREGLGLLALVERSMKLAHRLTHIRDEESKGRPLRGRGELRRALFLVTVCCYELSQ